MGYNPAMPTLPYLPIKPFATPEKWETWVKAHQTEQAGLWVKLSKKGSGKKSITYAEALDVALCYGWIDGQKKGFDDQAWLQKFTPRRAKSGWSKINVGHVARLIQEGRMQPAGLAAVEAAKKDGRWDRAYGGQKTSTIPEDFLKRLAKDKKAHAFFRTLNKANLYAIAYRLQTAAKPETRAKRMEVILEKLGRGEAFHFYKPKEERKAKR